MRAFIASTAGAGLRLGLRHRAAGSGAAAASAMGSWSTTSSASRSPWSSTRPSSALLLMRSLSSSERRYEEVAAAPLPKTSAPDDDAPAYSPDSTAQPTAPTDPDIKTAYLYFSLFPIRMGWWDIRCFLASLDRASLLERIRQAIPSSAILGHDFKLVDVQERLKDGGAFAVFQYRLDSASEQRDSALLEIENHLQRSIKTVSTPWAFFLGKPAVHVVRGKPWLEDLNRFPAQRIKITLEGGQADIGEEQLWETLRPYGRIKWLEKVKPNEFLASFAGLRGATIARNCVYGFQLSNQVRMKINYERVFRARIAWEWLQSHPRIVIPILAVLAGTLANLFFDPIRSWFVQSKVTNLFDLERYSIFKFIKRKTEAFFRPDEDGSIKEDDWWERKEAAGKIAGWLKETPSTFITLTGPRGSGKHQLLARAIPPEIKHLTIDCDVLARSSKTDAGLLSAVAAEVGYWPVFSWLNSLGNLIDLASVGLIGSKAGFATPADQQLRAILSVATTALVDVKEKSQKVAERRRKAAKQAEDGGAEKGAAVASNTQILSEKARLEAAEEARKAAEEEEKRKQSTASGVVSSITAAGSAALSGVTTELNKGVDSMKSTLGAGSVGAGGKRIKSDEEKERTVEQDDASRRDELGPESGLSPEVAAQAIDSGYDVPVVVIKHFCHKAVKQPLLWSALSEWAAELVTNQIAHVVFVSDHQVAANKELSKALPNIPFDQIVLADADEERARAYVYQKLVEMGRIQAPPTAAASAANPEAGPEGSGARSSTRSLAIVAPPPALSAKKGAARDAAARTTTATTQAAVTPGLDADTAKWVDKLGGRLTDLETLVQKVSLGQSVDGAVQDIIARTVVELRKNAFGDDAEDAKNLAWTRDQAWAVVSALAKEKELSYYGTLHDIFKGDEAALKAMESADVIAVRHVDSRPHTIHAGRPVFQSAIQRLLSDEVFADTRTYEANVNAIAAQEKVVRAAEAELRELVEVAQLGGGGVGGAGTAALRARAEFLLQKMEAAQSKVADLDESNVQIKARLIRTRSTERGA